MLKKKKKRWESSFAFVVVASFCFSQSGVFFYRSLRVYYEKRIYIYIIIIII